MVIIPGNETTKTVSIIGTMDATFGVDSAGIAEVIDEYKNALDTGSVLTVLEKQTGKKPEWVLFKIETPVTKKYKEPESDLYYVTQGQYALYTTWVAIKKETLSKDFVAKWSKIFKQSKLVIE
jgi:hypothetical protein